MKHLSRNRVYNVVAALIFAEIIILAIVGSLYINNISDAIDRRVESQVQIPGN